MSATASANPYQSPASDLTPSGFAPTTELAGRGTRLAASILDGLFSMAFMLPGVLVMLLGMENAGAGSAGLGSGVEMFAGVGGALILAGFMAWAIITGGSS